ncbi:flagellin N-terminal helical domain-containing protein [Thiovibrio sp. JS02]
MALRINTNVAALNAHKNMIKNDNGLSSSLEKLSSGLRINKAADDASGMAIADSLKSQALGLGQAIRNANDGISMVQTADGALEESINIVNTIKTKAIQAAQDGQTTESRKAIQSDINKLMEELDIIAKTTAFNNQKLLSGNFTNKKFQVGAYSGETVSISIGSTESTKVGHISTSNLTFGGEGTAKLNLYSNLQNQTYSLNSVEIAYDNTRDHSLAAVADAINKLSDVLGISAEASVVSTGSSNVAAGTTDSSFAINGVTIGSLTVQENDANGALVASINAKTDQHGVLASVDSAGQLTLTSTDGRAIQVTQDTNTTAVLGGSSMSTLGEIKLKQAGAGEIVITDQEAQAGIAVSSADGLVAVSGVSGATTSVSVMTAGTYLASGTALASGTVVQGAFTLEGGPVAGMTTDANVVGAGSIIISGSTIGCGSTLTGDVKLNADAAATVGDSTLAAGSQLISGTYVESGSMFAGDVTAFLSGAADGSVVLSGGNTYVTSGASVKTGGLTLAASATVASGSTIEADSILKSGSKIGQDLVTEGATTLSADMTVTRNSSIESGSTLATGSYFATAFMSGNGTVTANMTLEVGSELGAGSIIANGSSLGSTYALREDETVAADKSMVLAAGSLIDSGSTIAAGTTLTNDIYDENGTVFAAGTTLTRDIVTGSGVRLESDMVVKGGSILQAGTQIAVNSARVADTVESATSAAQAYRLSDVDVTTQEGAQIAIAIADSALKSLDKTRSDLGSVQNQLTSTIANISTTRVNISAAESSIRDVDFAEESANFSKMQILTQASSFAMAQANASSQTVLSLLQG